MLDWVESLNKALDYIEENLLENITCAAVADHVFISNAHLQRTFFSLTGLTLGEYIRNRRLTLAGQDLLKENGGSAKVIDIALKYGYETPESFSKAFSRFHNVAPSQARRAGVSLKSYNRLTVKIIMEGGSIMDYRIEKKEAFPVIVMARVIGEDSSSAIPAFWDEYMSQGMHSKVPGAMGVCGEMTAKGKEFKYGIGCPEEWVRELPDGFERWVIPANTWAVFKCVGAMPDAIQSMWKKIYSEWLPQAKYELVQSPYEFEYYTEGDSQSPDYVSEIWIPVKEK